MPGSTCFHDAPPHCPACDGPGGLLGQLGGLVWWCCRCCSMQFSTPGDDDVDPWEGTDEW